MHDSTDKVQEQQDVEGKAEGAFVKVLVRL